MNKKGRGSGEFGVIHGWSGGQKMLREVNGGHRV